MKKNGFILLEALLSLVILGTVLIVSIQALASYTRTTSSAKNMNIAAAQAQTLLTKVYLNDNKALNLGQPDTEHPDFTSQVNESKISDTESQYEIIIKWNERGTDKDLRVITCKTKNKI
ncbi:MAG: hypothetical protein A3J83_08795 [Elusimicrobia bacterium RIFOXYA2_FULL_40_6]|nr:MAG: hypothetical protein A3J83_08795 [Elusimicrobia bacterium RIFOXYA2_FULL_40_6]